MRHKAKGVAAGALAIAIGPLFGQAALEVPFELRGQKIVARGTIEGGRRIRMLIDTGASCSVVDRSLASKMKLVKMPTRIPVVVHGRVLSASSVLIHDLRLGPITTSRTCIAGDIPLPGIEMIVGLDVLRRHNLTIDMACKSLIFESDHAADFELPFDPDSNLITVPARLEDREIRLVLDTGAEMACLDGGKAAGWLPAPLSKFSAPLVGMSGNLAAREIYLRDLRIGPDRWPIQRFLILQASRTQSQVAAQVSWDGILAPGPLGIKRLHIDFSRGLVQWSR